MDETIAIIDLRSAEAHARERPAGAVRLSLADLSTRPHFLPPHRHPLVLVGDSEPRLAAVRRALEAAGRRIAAHYPLETWSAHLPREVGPPSRTRLWEPARVVEQALALHAAAPGTGSGQRALDLACGTGRNAVFLALAGYEVTAVDILPDALLRAGELAAHHGVTLRTLELDLERAGALQGLEADLIVVVRFLSRPLYAQIAAALRPGGILAYETFTAEQLRHAGQPRNPRFLLRPGELLEAFPGLEVLHHESDSTEAHVERLVARQPAPRL